MFKDEGKCLVGLHTRIATKFWTWNMESNIETCKSSKYQGSEKYQKPIQKVSQCINYLATF